MGRWKGKEKELEKYSSVFILFFFFWRVYLIFYLMNYSFLYSLFIFLLAQHVSGTIMPIIRSSRVLYRLLLLVVFGALVFKLSVWCGAEGYMSGLQAAVLKLIMPHLKNLRCYEIVTQKASELD